MDKFTFDDRVVVVTGAGRGLGRAYAALLASRGAKVVVADLGATVDGAGTEQEDPATSVVGEITSSGGAAVAVREDVSRPEGAEAIVQAALDSFGRLDAVINNAGIVRAGPLMEVDAAEHQRNLDVHYFGSLHISRAAWPHLAQSGEGRIVNTISAAMLGVNDMAHYGSSKAAVLGLTRNLAMAGMDDGIRVNAIAPGAGTRMAEASAAALPDEVMEYMRTQMRPEMVAPLAAYLAHPACRVTGETFNAAAGGFSRLALVNTAGIHDPQITIEGLADRFDEVMALTDEAEPQVVASLRAPAN